MTARHVDAYVRKYKQHEITCTFAQCDIDLNLIFPTRTLHVSTHTYNGKIELSVWCLLLQK